MLFHLDNLKKLVIKLLKQNEPVWWRSISHEMSDLVDVSEKPGAANMKLEPMSQSDCRFPGQYQDIGTLKWGSEMQIISLPSSSKQGNYLKQLGFTLESLGL